MFKKLLQARIILYWDSKGSPRVEKMVLNLALAMTHTQLAAKAGAGSFSGGGFGGSFRRFA